MSPVNRFFTALVAVSLMGSASVHTAAARPGLRWLIAGRVVQDILRDPAASRALDGTSPFVVQRNAGIRIPSSWNAVRVRTFTSYRDLERAFARRAIAPDVQAIMYDNEAWRFTPAEEQRDPAKYDRLAADLVHAHRLIFIAAPASDLVSVLSPGTVGGKRYERYIELRIAEAAARYADVYDIQAQGSQRNLKVFTTFVRAAAEQARKANPKIVILAGVSTNPSGQPTQSQDILNAIASTRGVVDGYWLNVPSPSPQCPRCTQYRPDIALDVLRRAG